MAIIGIKPILEIPACFEDSDGRISLEDAIRRDFSDEGLDRFKRYNVRLECPINDGFSPLFRRYGILKSIIEPLSSESREDRTIGRIYQLFNRDGKIESVYADNVDVALHNHNDRSYLHLTFDLNAAKPNGRYLRMIFHNLHGNRDFRAGL